MSSLRSDDDRTSGGAGRFRQVIARLFGDAENPLGWALTVGTVAGIRVRVHLFFVIFLIGTLLWSIPQGHTGVLYMLILMAALFGVVLAHEFGHCFACRRSGGEADEILMWPLGGLASCAPPHTWRANMITTVGGPAVNVVIFPITTGALVLTGHSDKVFFNPLRPIFEMGDLGSYWMVALVALHYVNLLILAFNVLVPMYPMDGGRMLHAGLWARLGYREATDATTIIGMIAAGALAVAALVVDETMLLAIAILGGLMCWRERQMLRAEADLEYTMVGARGYGPTIGEDDASGERRRRMEEKQAAREAKEQAELDRILAKIADVGMGKLTAVEKRVLKRATRQRRGG